MFSSNFGIIVLLFIIFVLLMVLYCIKTKKINKYEICILIICIIIFGLLGYYYLEITSKGYHDHFSWVVIEENNRKVTEFMDLENKTILSGDKVINILDNLDKCTTTHPDSNHKLYLISEVKIIDNNKEIEHEIIRVNENDRKVIKDYFKKIKGFEEYIDANKSYRVNIGYRPDGFLTILEIYLTEN